MSGRSVPAEMPLAIWLVESRLVVMWTLTPLLDSNGARTSLKALSSAPPQAVQTVTSVLDAPPPPLLELPPPHAATRKSAPTKSAPARVLRLDRVPAIYCCPPKIRPLWGPAVARCAHQDERSPWLTAGY